MQLSTRDFLMALAVPLIWGMGVVFAKAAIGHFPPILLMAIRFSLSALLLVWFVKPPVKLLGKIFGVALVSAAIQYSLTFNGLRGVDASTAALIIQLEVPFLVILGAIFLKEKPGIKKWLGIVVAFIGASVIYGAPELAGADVSLMLIVGGAFAWAVGQVMARSVGQIGGMTLLAWVSVFAAPQLFVMSFIFEEDHLTHIQNADWVVWGTVAYLGIVMTAIGYGLWYSLIQRHPLNRVGPFLLLLPVFSVLGGVLILGEGLTMRIITGGLIVIAGVAFIVIERAAPKPAPQLNS